MRDLDEFLVNPRDQALEQGFEVYLSFQKTMIFVFVDGDDDDDDDDDDGGSDSGDDSGGGSEGSG